VSLLVLRAVSDLPVVHLYLKLDGIFFRDSPQQLIQTFGTFTALRRLELELIDIEFIAANLSASICTCLQGSPQLEELVVHTHNSSYMELYPVLFIAPASSLFSGNAPYRPARLRNLSIEGPTYTVDKALSSHLDLKALQRFALPAHAMDGTPMVEEEFWFMFAKTAHTPGGLELKHLTPSQLSPGLVKFLLSFGTLEELHFSSGFCPHPLSPAGQTDLGAMASELGGAITEHHLMDVFFNAVLPAHKDNLRSLALCGDGARDEMWTLSKEYLASISGCQGLTSLHIPLSYPVAVKDLVSASQCSSPCVSLAYLAQ